jgi:DHA1 family inner membrane transport protein
LKTLRRAVGYLTATRLVVNTAHRFVFPFLPALARGLGISLERAGLLLSARSLAFLATPAVVGTVGRGERRVKLVVFGTSLMAVGCLVTAITGVAAGALVGFLLLGLGKPTFDAAAQAYVGDRTPFERRARVMSILELTWAGGLLVGAPLAGWLISRGGWRAPFWVLGIALGVAALTSRFAMEPDSLHDGATTRLVPNRTVIALLLVGFLFSFASENVFVVFGAWLEDDFGLSLAALGVASVVIGLGELAGEASVLAFADRIGPRRMIALGLAGSAVGYFLLAPAAASLGWGLAGLTATLIAFEVTIVATVPLASEIAPGARSRLLAWLMVGLGLGRALGDATGPLLYGWNGMPAPAVSSALASIVALVILLRLVEDP